jgi:hypothetical protein
MKKITLLFVLALLLGRLAAAQPAGGPARSLEFIENKGQWPAPVRYAAPLHGGRLFAEADGLTFVLLETLERPGHGPAMPQSPAPDGRVRGHALRLRFEGSRASQLIAEEPTAERRNYFHGADPAHWASGVGSYRQLRYCQLWPGIDARVYENAGQQLEYDFELAAGADPRAIAVRHLGAEALRLSDAGSLVLKTSLGSITEQAPRAWQTDAHGQRQPVPCRYVLKGSLLSFALGPYDQQRPLTIDPVVVFSTYSGSPADNWGFTATYDNQGNLYSGGIALEPGFPTTVGAFQTFFAGLIDITLIKYDVSRTGPPARLWSTSLGGSSSEFPHSLVVNSRNELVVLGSTSSSDFPTTAGAVQHQFGQGSPADPFGFGTDSYMPNGSDLVVACLNASGSALVGSTYLGGSSNDGILPLVVAGTTQQLPHNYGDAFRGDILVDAADNIYLASHTTSTDFPVGRGFNSQYRGGSSDGVVCKLNPALTSLSWSSFLGGSAADAAYSLQLDPLGLVYVAGGTLSPNLPNTAGSYLPSRPGGVDGFVARISADGSTLLRTTYVGTASYDQSFFLQLGTDGGVYLLGQTTGSYPVTPNIYTVPGGRQFIHKLNADLSTTMLATVFGSGRPLIDLDPTAFLVDRCDRVYICGWGGTLNSSSIPNSYLALNGNTQSLPVTAGAVQTTTDGDDFYLAQFAAGLSSLSYATFFGSFGGIEHVDGGTSRFDPRGVVYQAVCACGQGNAFPIPPGANTYSTTNPSFNCNNAAFVFNFQPGIANAGADLALCATAPALTLTGSPVGGIWSGPGVSGSVAAGFAFTPSLALIGVHTLTYTVVSTGLCTTSSTRRLTVEAPATVSFAPLPQPQYCVPPPGSPPLPLVPLQATPVGGSFSGPGVGGSLGAGFTFNPALAGNGSHTLTYTYSNGCLVTATRSVQVFAPLAGPDFSLCSTSPPQALTGSPAGGSWSGPGVSGSVAAGFSFDPGAAPAGISVLTYSLSSASGSCSASRQVLVTAVPTLALTPLPPLCTSSAPLPLQASPGGGVWSGPAVSPSPAGNGYLFIPATAGPGTYQLTYRFGTQPCQTSSTLSVTVYAPQAVSAAADTILCPGSTQPFALRGSPAGGSWSGPGVSGSISSGFRFNPTGLSGSHTLTYTLANAGCSSSAPRRVSILPAPTLSASWLPTCPEARLAPLQVQFSLASNTALTDLTWDFGDGSESTEPNPSHVYLSPGRYQPSVRLRFNNGRCEAQAAAPAVVVEARRIPNIITPNGDPENEYFRLGPGCLPRLQIFSRWGRRVFEASEYRDTWNAPNQPAGLYFYQLGYPDGTRTHGWLEVVK